MTRFDATDSPVTRFSNSLQYPQSNPVSTWQHAFRFLFDRSDLLTLLFFSSSLPLQVTKAIEKWWGNQVCRLLRHLLTWRKCQWWRAHVCPVCHFHRCSEPTTTRWVYPSVSSLQATRLGESQCGSEGNATPGGRKALSASRPISSPYLGVFSFFFFHHWVELAVTCWYNKLYLHHSSSRRVGRKNSICTTLRHALCTRLTVAPDRTTPPPVPVLLAA